MESSERDRQDPMFEAVWQAIRQWDIDRDSSGYYAEATGTDVMAVLAAVRPVVSQTLQEIRKEIEGLKKEQYYSCAMPQCHDSFANCKHIASWQDNNAAINKALQVIDKHLST